MAPHILPAFANAQMEWYVYSPVSIGIVHRWNIMNIGCVRIMMLIYNLMRYIHGLIRLFILKSVYVWPYCSSSPEWLSSNGY